MNLVKELAKVEENSRRQFKNTKGLPLILSEVIASGGTESENMICHGDNRGIMKSLTDEYGMKGKIKLIYIDPPFFSKSNYDAIIKTGKENIKHLAYEDRWQKGLSEYLKMLSVRLMLMKELLSDDGLIWIHLDWHVVHYAKILMDEIFDEKNFVNEIIWTYKSGGSTKKHFARKHDTLLVYSKTSKYKFHPLEEKSYNRQFKPYRFKGVKEYRDDVGWYTMVNMKDVWNIDMVGRTSGERTGYATQKPEKLLERIIESCSEEGDICADFFCGSGTLPAVADRMGRRFICCDAGRFAVESTVSRLSRQQAAFSVYETKPEKKVKIKAEIEKSITEIPGSSDKVIKIKIKSVKEYGLSGIIDESSKEKVRALLKEDSLKMIQAWSVDFNNKGDVHRPDLIYVRTNGDIETTCEKILTGDYIISIKIVDIFGNVIFERI